MWILQKSIKELTDECENYKKVNNTAEVENIQKQIKIVEEKALTDADRETLRIESEDNRSKGIALADEICRQYRREGRFFDEILKAGE